MWAVGEEGGEKGGKEGEEGGKEEGEKGGGEGGEEGGGEGGEEGGEEGGRKEVRNIAKPGGTLAFLLTSQRSRNLLKNTNAMFSQSTA